MAKTMAETMLESNYLYDMENVIEIWDYPVEGEAWRIGVVGNRVVLAVPVVAEDDIRRLTARLVRRLRARIVPRRSDAGDKAAAEIGCFLRGDCRKPDFDVMLVGTDFQIRVWQEMMRIGFGERVSYGELARRCGVPGGARAVAGACGANAVLIAVPCHRVVAADGLGGFSAGLDLKVRLLALEG